MITAVAIKQGGRIFSLPSPARHHDLIVQVILETGDFDGEKGFLDSDGNFLSREEAGKMALGCGQLEKLPHPPQLSSEDLW